MNLFFLLFLCVFSKIEAQDIVACGGVVKTSINSFEFKKITAKLFFSDDSLNYETDILPNGAFSVPIYDLGDYVLKVSGPKGWYFEPENGYKLQINDRSTCNDNYNFQFAGFSIFGKISTANIDLGPSGIHVDVLKNNEVQLSTKSVQGGDFAISRIMPGYYTVRVNLGTNKNLIDEKDTIYEATVENDNVYIKDSFIIQGFPVIGDIYFSKEAVSGVTFFLFSKEKINKEALAKYKCREIDDAEVHTGFHPFCKVKSNAKGEFLFPLLPGGKYILKARYNQNSKFEIKPSQHEFEVSSHMVNLKGIFTISGFSLIGKVKDLEDKNIVNAEVYINGELKSRTMDDGKFLITGAQNGLYDIWIQSEGYLFDKTRVTFNHKKTDIGIFKPTKVSICGFVTVDISQTYDKPINDFFRDLKLSLLEENSKKVVDSIAVLSQDEQNKVQLEKKDNLLSSSFCFYAKPGQYVVQPNMKSSVSSFSLAPSHIKVDLKSTPVFVKFSQFRGKVFGSISCLELCKTGDFEVILKNEDSHSPVQLTQHISVDDSNPKVGSFVFQNVNPGKYSIELVSTDRQMSISSRWCWSKSIYSFTLIDENINLGVIFDQTGYSLPILSSHSMNVSYYYYKNGNESNKDFVETLKLNKGRTNVCLKKAGKYEFHTQTCHNLRQKKVVISTDTICASGQSESGKQIEATTLFHGTHLSDCIMMFEVDKFLIVIYSETDGDNDMESSIPEGVVSYRYKQHDVEEAVKWNVNKKRFEYWAVPGISMTFNVKSNWFLVKPDTFRFSVNKNTEVCETKVGKFKLEVGKFINGQIKPAMADVEVSVSEIDPHGSSNLVTTTLSDENGQFKMGPLNNSFQYQISLSKSNYSFIKAQPNNTDDYVFTAHKLSELKISVIDTDNGNPVQGILLSIIGDEYRKNELTNEHGCFSFLGLISGKYYIQPMMKELEFYPSGAILVEMKDGIFKQVEIKAKRTSFSLYGKVVSLSGESESMLTVEALKMNIDNKECKSSLYRTEYGITDELSQFRIRGLVPNCRYMLQLKDKNYKDEYYYLRTYPNKMVINMNYTDVENVKLIAIRDFSSQEVSAMVWTDEKYLDSLQISVFPMDNPDNILMVHKFPADPIFFHMHLPQSSKDIVYVIRLQSNLNPSIFSNITSQERTISVPGGQRNSLYRHFNFHFQPVEKSANDVEVTLTLSAMILPLLILLFTLLLFKKQEVEPMLMNVIGAIRGFVMGGIFSTSGSASTTTSVGSVGGSTTSNASSASSNSNDSGKMLDSKEITEINKAIAKVKPIVNIANVKKVPFWQRSRKV